MTPTANQRIQIHDPPVPRARSNHLRAMVRLLLALIVGVILPLAYLCRALPIRNTKRRFEVATLWTQRWSKIICRLIGIRVQRHGPAPPHGALLTSNHVSYADVLALASVIPCFFTPKVEIRKWPLIGLLVRLTEHPFVTRVRGKNILATTSQIEERLEAGTHVCVFLEGTTTGGDHLLPFKPSMLQPALHLGAQIVPVALCYGATDPAVSVSHDIAYWRNAVFFPHLWRLAGLRGIQVDVHFGRPRIGQDQNRREVADSLRREVKQMAGLSEESNDQTEPDQPNQD